MKGKEEHDLSGNYTRLLDQIDKHVEYERSSRDPFREHYESSVDLHVTTILFKAILLIVN
jgi:hypothetical protein